MRAMNRSFEVANVESSCCEHVIPVILFLKSHGDFHFHIRFARISFNRSELDTPLRVMARA